MDPKIIRAIYLSPHSAIWSRDGYRTVVEDRNRSFYRPAEIKVASCNVS
jgi:hypothetical protein